MNYDTLAGELLSIRASRQIRLHERQMEKSLRGEVSVLSYLQKHDKQAHPKNLSDEVAVSTARMAVILNHLEHDGMIRRIPDEEDNRQTIVILNDKGVDFLDQCRKKVKEYLVEIVEKMGEEDFREYVRLRRKLMQVLSDH